jgi:hypothetical protein
MTETTEEAKAAQREVQRMLGRCLLRLQQYERLIKAIVAQIDVSGPIETLEEVQAERAGRTSRTTLGTLVGELLRSFLVTETGDPLPEIKVADSCNAHVSVRMQLVLPEEDLRAAETDLKDLVQLRNGVVHTFVDQHDLWSIAGCLGAQEALRLAYERIEESFARLVSWADDIDRTRQAIAGVQQSEETRRRIVAGISGEATVIDGKVFWQSSDDQDRRA